MKYLRIVLKTLLLGWVGDDVWDIEINYENLIDITSLHLIPNMKGNITIRSYFKYNLFCGFTECNI